MSVKMLLNDLVLIGCSLIFGWVLALYSRIRSFQYKTLSYRTEVAHDASLTHKVRVSIEGVGTSDLEVYIGPQDAIRIAECVIAYRDKNEQSVQDL